MIIFNPPSFASQNPPPLPKEANINSKLSATFCRGRCPHRPNYFFGGSKPPPYIGFTIRVDNSLIPKSALSGTPIPAHFAVKTRLYSHCPYEYSLSI